MSLPDVKPAHIYTFAKKERLCKETLIADLYKSPCRLLEYPLSIHWMVVDKESLPAPAQVLIVAPKRKLRRAVWRNRTKRLIRESYRHHKHQLYTYLLEKDKGMVLGINYIGNNVPTFSQIDHAVSRGINKLLEQLENKREQV